MRAIVKAKREPGLWLEEVPSPDIGPNDVRIKIKKASICGTDLHIYKWDEWAQETIDPPTIIGHEFMGEVLEVGSRVVKIKPGDRVSGEGHITCGKCRPCRTGNLHVCTDTRGIGVKRDGAFADELVLPGRNIVPLPDSIEDRMGALLDPLGNAVHTALSFDVVGEDVLLTGAGPIGLMAVAVLKRAGAKSIVITDINPDRLELARQMGATAAFDVSKIPFEIGFKELGIEHFAVGLEMSGTGQGLQTLTSHLMPGGGIALLGILPKDAHINWDEVIFKGITLKGIYGRKMYHTWYQMLNMLEAGLDITPLITHELPFEKFEEGFKSMIGGTATKVILSLE